LARTAQFSSRHRGGLVNAAFVDGSVRTLAPSLEPHIFEAMATIAGGEEIGSLDW
jgi:prepilin-type processing-associated H-X9-DG protein